MNSRVSPKKIRHSAKLTSKSIESSGLPTDYKAIAEYIWNGFDAGADTISINFVANEIGFLNEFSISDNGSGIQFSELKDTFGNFNVSQKKISFSDTGFIKGKKGKGRFSFVTFCNQALWETTFEDDDGRNCTYKIQIDKENSQDFSTFDNKIVKGFSTGTKVNFIDFHSLTGDILDSDNFHNFLANEFGWFLYLNKEEDFKILINNQSLNYFTIIEENEDKPITIGDYAFKVSYLRWKNKIGEKYYYYFLDSSKKHVDRKHTTFNNKTENFHHSLYIESDYFNDYKSTEKDIPSLGLSGKNQTDHTFKSLTQLLNNYVALKEKQFIKQHQAEKLIEDFNRKSIFPHFRNNNYEQLRKKDLENVVKELYAVQPKLFQGLKDAQNKTIVGFLNLILDSEQREDILSIVENVVKLSDEERSELSNVLKNTKLVHITELVKFLENRFTVVSSLKTLIYDLERFTNERDHIQKVIENNYWLFGEQYHMVSADQNFEVVLHNYLHFVEIETKLPIKMNSDVKLKRPDIFIARKVDIQSMNDDSMIEDNILVELKRPSVVIGKKQFSQVEDYMNIIISKPEFNSQLRNWKFYIIGKEVDPYIRGLYKNQSVKNKKFLVQEIDNFEIYAMTWDDIFRVFDNRHKNFISKLEFKKSIIEELESKGIVLDNNASDYLVRKVINQ